MNPFKSYISSDELRAMRREGDLYGLSLAHAVRLLLVGFAVFAALDSLLREQIFKVIWIISFVLSIISYLHLMGHKVRLIGKKKSEIKNKLAQVFYEWKKEILEGGKEDNFEMIPIDFITFNKRFPEGTEEQGTHVVDRILADEEIKPLIKRTPKGQFYYKGNAKNKK